MIICWHLSKRLSILLSKIGDTGNYYVTFIALSINFEVFTYRSKDFTFPMSEVITHYTGFDYLLALGLYKYDVKYFRQRFIEAVFI
jgi:hypothetical protein